MILSYDKAIELIAKVNKIDEHTAKRILNEACSKNGPLLININKNIEFKEKRY